MSYPISALALGLLVADVAHAQDVDVEALSNLSGLIRVGGILTSLIVVLATWFVLRLVRNSVARLSARFATWRLALNKFMTVFQFVVYIVTFSIVIVLSVRLDDRSIALVGGTIAVSVGFAVKDLVASFIAGIMIMVDRPFQVGDRVSFGGFYGDITSIGLRSVRMQTLSDDTVTIPNNKFLNDITSSGNYGALDMMVVMEFFVGLDQDVTTASQVVQEAAVTSQYTHLPKPVVVLVKQVIEGNYPAVRLTLKAYVLDTRHEKLFETDINLRVLATFRQLGILPPAVLHRGNPPTLPTEERAEREVSTER